MSEVPEAAGQFSPSLLPSSMEIREGGRESVGCPFLLLFMYAYHTHWTNRHCVHSFYGLAKHSVHSPKLLLVWKRGGGDGRNSV